MSAAARSVWEITYTSTNCMGNTANDRASLIDEYGELSRQIAEFKPTIDRHKMLGALIQSWFENVPADAPAQLEGRRYTLQISPRDNSTSLKSIREVYRLMGVSKFLEHCSITLKSVKEVLGEAAFQRLVVVNRIGPRTLKPVAKASLRVVA